MEDVVNVGDEIVVKLVEIDAKGRMNHVPQSGAAKPLILDPKKGHVLEKSHEHVPFLLYPDGRMGFNL